MPGAFAKKQEELEKRLREQELAVLVWGPGVGGGKHHEKRRKIRQALEEHFSKSEVRFSEDLKQLVPGAPRHRDRSAAGISAGALGCLRGPRYVRGPSRGDRVLRSQPVEAQAHRLHARPPQGERELPAQLREGLEHHFYSDAEYASCSLVERVCDRMRHVALGQASRGQSGLASQRVTDGKFTAAAPTEGDLARTGIWRGSRGRIRGSP